MHRFLYVYLLCCYFAEFISSSSFCVVSLDFSIYSIISSAYRKFYCFPANLDFFYLFIFCMIAMTRLSNTTLSRSGDSGHPCLVPCWEPAWETLPMAKVMRKEASAYAKAGSSLRRPPVPEHLPPKPESAYFTASCSHLHLWLYGGLSPTTSLGEGVNLQFQSIKIPGRDKSVSTYKLPWRFSSLPEQVRPATCDCLQPPNSERHEML